MVPFKGPQPHPVRCSLNNARGLRTLGLPLGSMPFVNLPHFSGGVPYYPFLAELSRPEELMDKAEELPRVRVLACSECTEGLHSQWAKYQGENVPIEERNYFYQVGSLPNSIN